MTAVSRGDVQGQGDGKDGRTAANFPHVEDFSAPGTLRSGTLCLDEVAPVSDPLCSEWPFLWRRISDRRNGSTSVSDPGGAKGQINYSFQTRGWEKLTTPAGAFDAIRIDVLITLDDSTPFRDATNCTLTYSYSPTVRGTVRERRSAQYMEISGMHVTTSVLQASYELASFTPGKP